MWSSGTRITWPESEVRLQWRGRGQELAGCSVWTWAKGGEITSQQMTSCRPFREQCDYCSGPMLWVLFSGFFFFFNFFQFKFEEVSLLFFALTFLFNFFSRDHKVKVFKFIFQEIKEA